MFQPHDAQARSLALELLDYVSSTFGQYAKALDSGGDSEEAEKARRKGRRKRFIVRQAFKDFIDTWNGPYWVRGQAIRIEPPGSTRSKEEVARHMAATCFCNGPLRGNPPPPEAGKWTKLGPATDWHVCGDLPHGMNSEILPVAFAGVCDEYLDRVDAPADPRSTGQEKEATNWHAVAGASMQRCMELHQDAVGDEIPERILLRILLVCLEPVRFITCWFLVTSRSETDPCKPPYLYDLTNPSVSPIVLVAQYLRALGAGVCSRLRLLYLSEGFTDVRSWCAARPKAYELFRRVVQLVAAWLEKKHWKRLRSWPWVWARINDPRTPAQTKHSISEEPFRKGRCCVCNFAYNLATSSGSAVVLRGQRWRFIGFGWARLVDKALSIADLERGHHASRTFVTSATSGVEGVLAAHVNLASRSSAKSMEKTAELSRRAANVVAPATTAIVPADASLAVEALVVATVVDGSAKRPISIRARSAKIFFQKDLHNVDGGERVLALKGSGSSSNRFTGVFCCSLDRIMGLNACRS